MNRIFAARIAGLLLLAVPLCAAQDDTIRRIIVRNDGPGPRLESFVRNRISSAVGDPLSRAQISRDIRSLLDSGRFATVQAEVEETDDGLILIFAVHNRLRLSAPITMRGSEKFSVSRIRDLMDLSVDAYIDDQVLAVRSRIVLDAYAKKHYTDVVLTWKITPSERQDGRATVTIDIDEGDRLRVGGFAFTGNKTFSSRKLAAEVRRFRYYNPFSWFRRIGVNEEQRIEIRETIRQYYLNRGYLDVTVGMPGVESDDDKKLIISIHIDEGPRYLVGSTSFKGNTLFPENILRDALRLEEGDLATSTLLRDAAGRVRDYYGSRGYINAGVAPLLGTDAAAGRVDIAFEIREGELTYVRNVFIHGNDRTKDKVIRRELLVYPGERYDEVKMRRSERRLMNLGFFSKVDSYPSSAREGETERDLIIEVEEQRTGNMVFGIGFSSIDKIIGFAELSQGNFDISGWPFMGAGQKLNLRAQFGSRRQDYSLSFTEPWFLDRKLSFGFDIFAREREFEGFAVRRRGAALRVGTPLLGRLRMDVQYKIEEERISDSSDTNVWFTSTGDEFFFTTDQDATESSLRVRLTHDTRNRVFIPTRGHRVVTSARLAGGPLGMDTDLYGLDIRSDLFIPVFKGQHVLGFQVRAEVVEEYGDTTELLIFDRLFIGGGRTLRGYEFRDVGPKVVQKDSSGAITDHRPIGGRTFGLFSVEYVVPLTQGLRLAGFYDRGNVWDEAYDFDFGSTASSAGLELRLDIPQFPVRFYYAWSIESDDELTNEEPFGFWIGF